MSVWNWVAKKVYRIAVEELESELAKQRALASKLKEEVKVHRKMEEDLRLLQGLVAELKPRRDTDVELRSLREYVAKVEDDNADMVLELARYRKAATPQSWVCPTHGCASLSDDGDYHLCEKCNQWWRDGKVVEAYVGGQQ